MIQDNVIIALKESIIEFIGIENYNKKIQQIADVLNDLDYKQVELPTKALTDLVIEAVEDETHKYYRRINTAENANSNTPYRDTFGVNHQGHTWKKKRSANKWKWKSTAEKIMLLQEIEKLRKEKVSWPKLQRRFGLDARSFIYNIVLAKVYATKLEMKIAHRIWENMKHGKKDGFKKMQEQRTNF